MNEMKSRRKKIHRAGMMTMIFFHWVEMAGSEATVRVIGVSMGLYEGVLVDWHCLFRIHLVYD